jgi:hypothetical protein
VRHWGLIEWSEFPDLAWSLAHSGHAEQVRGRPAYQSARQVQVEVSR